MQFLYKEPGLGKYILGRLKSMLIPDSLQRISAKNRLSDYRTVMKHGEKTPLWRLHADLEEVRERALSEYDSYDYGNGYYYQSLTQACISGYRNTDERITEMGLRSRLQNMSVLDIGSNTGFLLLALSDVLKEGRGIELNPFLVEAADLVRDYMNATNIQFECGSFEEFKSHAKEFDAVLSLANHSTHDGNTVQTLEEYFDKILELLLPGGQLIFESHPPEIEPPEKLQKTLEIIERKFDIIERPTPKMRGFLDKNRTYVIAVKRPRQ